MRRRLTQLISLELWVIAVAYVWALAHAVAARGWAIDAHAYWSAWRVGLYQGVPGTGNAYLYSPAFAEVIWPLTRLPWVVFAAVWMMLSAALFAWLLAPLRWRWGVPAFVFCLEEITLGNVNALLAVMVVLGARRPAVWTFGLLTKIGPGLGLLWWVLRRDWRALVGALGAVSAAAGVSLLIDPGAWVDWARHLLLWTGVPDPSYLPRLVLAVLVTIWAARSDRYWPLAIAVVLASPVLWIAGFSVLAAIPRALREHPGYASAGRTTPSLPLTRNQSTPLELDSAGSLMANTDPLGRSALSQRMITATRRWLRGPGS